MKIKKALCICLAVPMAFAESMTVNADEASVNPYGEPFVIRCTCYTASEGDITKSGSEVREGIVAGKDEWLGCVAAVWDCEDGSGDIGDFLGYYEFKDTGAGIDTDGDGCGDSIINGTSIDMYRDSMAGVQQWIDEHGDYVFVQIIRGEG